MLTCETYALELSVDFLRCRLKKLELVFIASGFVALATWILSDEYWAYGAIASICFLALASIYLFLTSQEKIYRLFVSISLTVITAALGIALLRMSGLSL